MGAKRCDRVITGKQICTALTGSIVYPLDDYKGATTFCRTQRARLRKLWKCKRTTDAHDARYHCVTCHKSMHYMDTLVIPVGLPPVPCLCVDCGDQAYLADQHLEEHTDRCQGVME